jgi:hypothetical protein
VKNSFTGRFVLVVVLLAAFSSLGFAAPCTTWMLGNGTTTIAPGTSASGTTTGTIPCTVGTDTFSNFYVYNGTTSTTDIAVGVGFSAALPAVLTFSVANLTTTTDFDAVYELSPGSNSITVAEAAALGSIDFTVCSVEFVNGQSCTGNGGTVLGGGIVSGSSTLLVSLAASPTGNDWVFEDVTGTTSFSNSFVPEPVTSSLMGVGLLALGFAGRKRLRKD